MFFWYTNALIWWHILIFIHVNAWLYSWNLFESEISLFRNFIALFTCSLLPFNLTYVYLLYKIHILCYYYYYYVIIIYYGTLNSSMLFSMFFDKSFIKESDLIPTSSCVMENYYFICDVSKIYSYDCLLREVENHRYLIFVKMSTYCVVREKNKSNNTKYDIDLCHPIANCCSQTRRMASGGNLSIFIVCDVSWATWVFFERAIVETETTDL